MKKSSTYFIADPHLGHKNIGLFRPHLEGDSELNTKLFLEEYKAKGIGKRSTVWFLGDVAMDQYSLDLIGSLPGVKHIVLGNHDDLPIEEYTKVFDKVRGMIKWKGLWLTHSPIHPDELRGSINVHGHVHSATVEDPDPMWRGHYPVVPDPRFINICPEERGGQYITNLEELREIIERRQKIISSGKFYQY